MCTAHPNYDQYTFSKHPDYIEQEVRKEFAKAVPLQTVVIYCYDPRVTGIPEAVAREFGDIFPGEVLLDEDDNKVASTATVFEVIVAGGRAVDAMRSVTVAQHLFGIKNIVVVHHTNCGATSFTADGLIDAFKNEQGTDISTLYERDSMCICDYRDSLDHDVTLLRQSPGTPKKVNIYGYLYDTDSGGLTKIVENLS